jgi:acrosin
MFRKWFERVFQTKSKGGRRLRPTVELLEDRTTPSVLFAPQSLIVNNGQLVVNGDQPGSTFNDTITIDVNAAGGVSVNLNGQVMNFGLGQITSIVVNTGVGYNAVHVNNEASGVPLTINDGSYDFVAIGSNGSVQGILGSVSISNPSYYTGLVIDDSLDAVGRTVTVTSTSVTGLAPAGIFFHYNDLSSLSIYGGLGSSTFNVLSTPSTYTGYGPGYTWIQTGSGSDLVNIAGTASNLYVYNSGGLDNVHVGNGTVGSIYGAVNISGTGATYLYVDDGSDPLAHAPTLTGSSLTGLAPATISWTASNTGTGGVTYLRIAAGPGNYINVNDTPNVLYSTDLFTGGGSQVNISRTTGSLNVNLGAGHDFVYVGGDGELTDISGPVNISGAGSIYLYLEDGSDPNGHSATLTRNSLTGLSAGAISWTPSFGTSGGVTFLEIFGSSAASTYTITDTPNVHLVTGLGDDTVSVIATTGALVVENDGGTDTVVLGRQATATTAGKVTAIRGIVDIFGAGTVNLIVDDGGDTSGRGTTLTGSSLTGLAPAEIDFDSNVASLTINAGNGNDMLTLASIPQASVIFNGGNGGDTLVGANNSTYWDITGISAGNVAGNVTFANVENLVGGTAVDTFWFEPGARVVSINGGGAPAGQGDWLDYANYPAVVSVNLTTGRATGVTSTIRNILNVFGGNFGNTLVGNALGNILVGGDGADVIRGGSGRSILIGGNGSDTIVGGSDDDVIIGGTTRYGTAWNEGTLMELLAHWQSADSYAARVSVLRNTWRPLVLGSTVFDDGAADRLTGGGGMDWFFAGSGDTIADYQGGEFVN